MFGNIKDSLVSAAARKFVAARIKRYGTLLDLHIQSRDRRISVEVLLDGEELPVHVIIGRYRIEDDDNGDLRMVVENAISSHSWVHNLLEDFLVGTPIPLPKVAMVAFGGRD